MKSAAVAVVVLAGASLMHAIRVVRTSDANTKFIAGVPVLNYHAAYDGTASMSTLEHAAYDGTASMSTLEETREREWIVTLQPGTTEAQIAALCQQSRKGCKMTGHPEKGGVAFLDMEGSETDLEAVFKSNRPVIKFAEPDQPVFLVPELEADPNAQASWGLNRVGANGRSGPKGQNTHIYILDTGVRTTHQDFGTRGTPGVDFTQDAEGTPVECNGDLGCAADRQGHGTHCAGSAAGTTFGVATQANVIGMKVLGDSGVGGLAAIIGAIDYTGSNDRRPAVASMSLGRRCQFGPLGFCGLFGVIKTAVDTVVDSGVTVVVAGGNTNSDACGFMPAFVPSAITVGSTDSTDARSVFSNYGECTNIWAPGSAITSASHEDDTGSKTLSGTSMACPHVAGAAAMVLQESPELKSEQVLEKLLARSARNYITDLKRGDINALLYVAADAPPLAGDVPAEPEPECPFYCVFCITEGCKGCCN